MKTGNRKKNQSVEVGPYEYLETTPEQLKETYKLSDEDVKFFCNREKLLKPDVVGWNKYASLLQKRETYDRFNILNPTAKPKTLTDSEIAEIEQYEAVMLRKETQIAESNNEYFKTVREKKKHTQYAPGTPIDKETMWRSFLAAFRIETGKDFVKTEDNIRNLECIIKYLTRDESFFDCAHLVKNIGGVDLQPDFSKGLLLVGRYGNGKSTMMKCFSMILNHNAKYAAENNWDNTKLWMNRRYAMAYCHNLVVVFDGLKKNHEKTEFFKKYGNFRYCFDDLGKEDVGSNYGKKDIMRVIFEHRYDNKALTHATLNYPDDAPGDIKAALDQLGNRYGGHINDRAYQMFNIIDFKGKSFRK